MDSLTLTQIIVGLVVATIGIQVTLGTIATKVLASRWVAVRSLYELQLHLVQEQRDHAERALRECHDDLDQCRERTHRQNGGIVI